MTSLLMQAAQSAAAADGLIASSSADRPQAQQSRAAVAAAPKKKGPPLRRGKWTAEEEAYANRLIQEFKAGLLPLTDGTTLRTFLSKLLNCDPMRISKKFVGGNCIGKQVFRRRNADLSRLTTEQIQQSRAELSDLERRFLERVAQTNRVKSSGVVAAAPVPSQPMQQQQTNNFAANENAQLNQPTPPWLQPPMGYRHGQGAQFATSNLSGANSRAAAAGRALLEGVTSSSIREALERKHGDNNMQGFNSGMLFADLQQRASQQNFLQFGNSAGNLLAAARGGTQNAMAQFAQSNSTARLAGLSNTNSMNNLMLKTGLSRDQLSQLARERGLSSGSLSNMIQRQNSFDALMSLDFQSLQSIDNLANLMQTGSHSHLPESGMKNADFGLSSAASRQNFMAAATAQSNGDLNSAARRLASAGRMESLLKTMSSNNMRNSTSMDAGGGGASAQNLQAFLQSVGSRGNLSAASLFGGNNHSAVSLANFLRQDSSTGLSALRMQDGLNQRNSSVDDFLSLVAAGDIPHQDPSLLNVPLMNQQQGGSSQEQTSKLLQQQLLQAQASGNSALANALASRSVASMQSFGSEAQMNSTSPGTAALAMAQARANDAKRKYDDYGDDQGSAKR